MTTVFHELLPESYLLRLLPGPANEPERALKHTLRRACRSGKPAVWVDCEQVADLPQEALDLLSSCHRQLRQQRMQLVLVHASEALRQHLLRQQRGSGLCFVPSIGEAVRQSSAPHSS